MFNVARLSKISAMHMKGQVTFTLIIQEMHVQENMPPHNK